MAATQAFLSNNKHIAHFEAKPQPEELSETAVTEAFGSWAYPKIVAGLCSSDAIIRAKSVVAARELLVAPEKHIQCIAAGITPALRDLLQPPADAAARPPDETLQASAASTMQLLVSREVGCRDALQHGCLPPLLQLLKQPNAAVRDAAYGALCAAAPYEPWRAALVREGAVGVLLLYAQEEQPQRAVCALDLLHHCAQARHNQDALTQMIAVHHAIPKLAALISGKPEKVCLRVVKLLAALTSTHAEGRIQAVEADCVFELINLLKSASVDVACAAASALMSLTLAKEGKMALHKEKGLAACLQILQGQLDRQHSTGSLQEVLTVSVLQTVTNSAEYGPCNVDLQRNPQLQVVTALHQQQSSSMVQAAAAQTLRMAGLLTSTANHQPA